VAPAKVFGLLQVEIEKAVSNGVRHEVGVVKSALSESPDAHDPRDMGLL
jgi:hypothetical protein